MSALKSLASLPPTPPAPPSSFAGFVPSLLKLRYQEESGWVQLFYNDEYITGILIPHGEHNEQRI